MEQIRVHVFVEGRVQGVFFRAGTKEKACQLGLTGWVRNCKDGRVEALFEGAKANVDKALEWCKRGTPSATVSHIEVKVEQPTGEFSSFTIDTESL